jgi:hypothetical protein
MVNSVLEFQSDLEADAGNISLVLTKTGLAVEQLLEFQIAMIAQNDIPGIAKLELKKLDSDVKLCYQLSGLISLTDYLKKQKISKYEFSEIVEAIISVLLKCKNYLLNDNSFILKEDYIYLNPRSKQVFLIYLPLETESAATQEFKSFLVNLLINTANIDTEDNYVQLLLNQIKADYFSLAEFREQLTQITGTGNIQLPIPSASGNVSRKEKKDDQLNQVELPHDELPKTKTRKGVLVVIAVVSVVCAVISALPDQFLAALIRLDQATAVIFG